jgi:hypothetical protein
MGTVCHASKNTHDGPSQVRRSSTGDDHISTGPGDPARPQSPFGEMPTAEPAELLAARRRARDGDLRARHLWLWCAAGRTPTDSAAVLCCSRARVSRTGRASQQGTLGWGHDDAGPLVPPVHRTVRLPTRRRSRVARLKAPPRAYGWCRTRWSGATLALTWQATRGLTVSAETRRRWVQEVDGVWKRPTRVAKDNAPRHVERLARLRVTVAPLQRDEAMVVADDLDSPRWPTVGSAWRPNGTPMTVLTPGTHAQPSLAGALALATGARRHGVAARTTNALFRDRLTRLDAYDPAARYTRLSGVVDHETIHRAEAVEPWRTAHPRLTWLWWPTDGPGAHPIARAGGEVHDRCTRHHPRTRRRALVADVEAQLQGNGPWLDQWSALSDEPAVTVAVEHLAVEPHAKMAA